MKQLKENIGICKECNFCMLKTEIWKEGESAFAFCTKIGTWSLINNTTECNMFDEIKKK